MLLWSWLTSVFGQFTATTGNSKFQYIEIYIQYIEKELQKAMMMWNWPAKMLSTRVLFRVVVLSQSIELVKMILDNHP